MKYKKIVASNNINDDVRKASSSGGFFYEIARYVLENNGIVIGASYRDNSPYVEHICIDNMHDLWKLQKSKYAPSSLKNIDINYILSSGKTVLFTGTPCQIKLIHKTVTPQMLERLILLEVACHGVPSKKEYEKYVNENHITKIDFRNKEFGWKNSHIKITHSDGTITNEPATTNMFYKRFISGENLMKSCFNCKAKYFTSNADFTAADAWGINDFAPELDDNKGSSIIILHTKKSCKIWESISHSFSSREITLLDAIRYNTCIVRPIESNPIFIEYVVNIWNDFLNNAIKFLHFQK